MKKKYEHPQAQVIRLKLMGNLLEDEEMRIGSPLMKVRDSDSKQWGGTRTFLR